MAIPKNFRQTHYERMAAEDAVLYLPKGRQSGTPPHQQPNYQVYEVKLKGRNDKPILISGNELTTPLQLSMLKALDMLADYRGLTLSFEEFWKYWEEGFSFAINRPGSPMVTNFPISDRPNADGTVTPGFRRDRETRPAYQRLRNPNAKANPSFNVVEYWPNRANPQTSYLLVGSDADLIRHILAIEYAGGSAAPGIPINEPKFTDSRSFKGLPKINIWFYESRETRDPNYLPMRARLGFRIIGKTERHDLVDRGETSLDKLTAADVRTCAARIFEQFGRPTPHRWHKGKESFSYRHKSAGLETWGFCYAKSDGLALVQKLTAAAGVPFIPKYFRHTVTEGATEAFPANPPDEKIMGETVKGSRLRPSGFVYFHGATLQLESLFAEVSLCDSNGVTFSEEKFKDRGATGFW